MKAKLPPLSVFAATDVGLLRSNNEDAWASMSDIGFFALADGMGGHQAGEVAANEALDALCLSIRAIAAKSLPLHELIVQVREAIEKANHWVYEMGRESDSLHGMGTTLCCIYWTPEAVIYAHVGDSRIYRIRDGHCEQLTTDHSLLAKWLSLGRIAEECETPFPYKNVITKAIGTSAQVQPEIAVTSFEPNDQFLLCTDGLSDVLGTSDIEKILERSESLEKAVTRLIEKAKIKGSGDNITALMVSYDSLSRQQRDNPPGSSSTPSDAFGLERPPSKPFERS
ncbi:MAG TPA: PP2C family serine/threonine-protein phosphatase [Chlamydiales bacterium]|jgi:protein phosphatase